MSFQDRQLGSIIHGLKDLYEEDQEFEDISHSDDTVESDFLVSLTLRNNLGGPVPVSHKVYLHSKVIQTL